MNRKRKKLLVFVLIFLVIGVGMLIYNAMGRSAEPKNRITVQSSSGKKEESIPSSTTETSETSTEEVTKDDTNHQTALSKLEKSDTPASKETKQKVIDALKAAQSGVQGSTNVANLEGTYENKMMMTTAPMVQTFGIAIVINHYSLDLESVEVYKSEHEDVVQFVFKLQANDKENSYWVGNYNIYAEQLQLTSYHGGDIGATYG